jgi:hypothetical protein
MRSASVTVLSRWAITKLVRRSEMYRQMVFMQFQGEDDGIEGGQFVSIPESDTL